MKNNNSFSGIWKSKDGINLKVNLSIIAFKEDESLITYCPALDIAGYGISETESIESFQHVLGEFLLYTTRKGTFIPELRRLGWAIKNSKRKPMLPPDMSELLQNNENFHRIFNNHDFRKFDYQVEMPSTV